MPDLKKITTPDGTTYDLRDSKLSSLIAVGSFTIDNISIPASTVSGAKTKSVAKSGYTPLMIHVSLDNASSSGTNSSGCVAFTQSLSGNTASVNIANRFNAAAKVKATITVIYVASS